MKEVMFALAFGWFLGFIFMWTVQDAAWGNRVKQGCYPYAVTEVSLRDFRYKCAVPKP